MKVVPYIPPWVCLVHTFKECEDGGDLLLPECLSVGVDVGAHDVEQRQRGGAMTSAAERERAVDLGRGSAL